MRCAQCSRGSQPPKAALHQRSQGGCPPLPPTQNRPRRRHIASAAGAAAYWALDCFGEASAAHTALNSPTQTAPGKCSGHRWGAPIESAGGSPWRAGGGLRHPLKLRHCRHWAPEPLAP